MPGSSDPLDVPDGELADISTLMTIVGGAVEFEAATAIADATDLAAARLAFKDWSDALMAKVDEHGVSHGVVYKMHCPMAFGNAGAAWLQDATAVRNPYYGASMLTCGRQVSAIQGDAAPGAHVH